MGIYVNPGKTGFEQMRKSTYVDKTGLIALINQTIETDRKLTCISRPRRFGKSYAAQMLCAYYDASCNSHDLFDDMEIAKAPDYETHINQYNVIRLDITGFLSAVSVKGQPIEQVITDILFAIEHELKELYPELSGTEDLLKCMKKCVEITGRKFIFVIDEWDAIIREAKDKEQIQKHYLNLLRSWFKNANYTADIIAAAYMTGILPIKKDGSQSAISEFKEYSVLDAGAFARYTGFLESEVQKLCQDNDMDFAKMKQWYDGYSFEDIHSVYNPYSVMSAIQQRKFKSYWKKTSAAESLLTYIDMNEDGLQKDITDLISGKRIEVDTNSFENDFSTFRDKNDVLTLLIHLGYLSYEEEDNGCGLARIPNEEVRKEFEGMLRKGTHPELIRIVQTSDRLLKDTIAGNEVAVADAIAKVRDTNYAPTFYNSEQALRYAIKMAYISSVDQYIKIEELPSGHGIADVVFLPKRYSHLPAMLVELKWDKTAESALTQIQEGNYPALLQGYGGELLLVAINYDDKTKEHTCKIKKEKK